MIRIPKPPCDALRHNKKAAEGDGKKIRDISLNTLSKHVRIKFVILFKRIQFRIGHASKNL